MRSNEILTTGRNWTERHIRELARQEIKKSGGGGHSDDDAFIKSMNAGFDALNMRINLSNTTGTSSAGIWVNVKPIKLCYYKSDLSSTKTLYCIYQFSFPSLDSNGAGFPNIVMPEMNIAQTIFVGNPVYAYGNIDVYNGAAVRKWRVEESSGLLTYYDYDNNFEQEYRAIQFPEHILKAVMYEMMPNNTYRYNYDGIARMFYEIVNSNVMSSSIKPYDVSSELDNLNIMYTIKPTAYSSRKTIIMNHMVALTKMPIVI